MNSCRRDLHVRDIDRPDAGHPGGYSAGVEGALAA